MIRRPQGSSTDRQKRVKKRRKEKKAKQSCFGEYPIPNKLRSFDGKEKINLPKNIEKDEMVVVTG